MTAPQLNCCFDQKAGPGAPTVALIHGVGDRLQAWGPVAERLSDRVNVLRYDLRGHGSSYKPPGPYDLGDFVDDHRRILASVGISKCSLAGFSLGGMIAQAIAVHAPETVERLVLIACVADRTPEEREAVGARLAMVEDRGPAYVASLSKDRWFTQEYVAAHPRAVDEHLQYLASNDPAAYAAAYRVLASNDLIEELPEITAPTLVIAGENDVGSPPRMAKAMHHAIRGSRLVIVPILKHALLTEAPVVIAGLLGDFLVENR